MKSLKHLILLLLALSTCWINAQESRLTPGNSFNLRLAAVPAEDTASVSSQDTLSSDGSFRLPYLDKAISASGLTATELQDKVVTLYKAAEIYTHPTVVVSFGGGTPEMVISVGGEVRTPSEVPFRPGINLFAAINRAGGQTEYADMKKVKVLRGKTEKIYDLRKVNATNNPELQAGDQVIVPGS